MCTHLTVREFRTNLSKYLAKISEGEEFKINGIQIGRVHGEQINNPIPANEIVNIPQERVHDSGYLKAMKELLENKRQEQGKRERVHGEDKDSSERVHTCAKCGDESE